MCCCAFLTIIPLSCYPMMNMFYIFSIHMTIYLALKILGHIRIIDKTTYVLFEAWSFHEDIDFI